MVYYFVQKGETLFAIAMRYQTTVHAIVTANRLSDPNDITPGQPLLIPRPGEVPIPAPGGVVHVVRPGETIFHLAARYRTTPQEILRANQVAHPEFILPGQQLVIPERMEAGDEWPTWGRTPGRAGVNAAVPSGAPVEGWRFAPETAGICLPSAPVVRYGKVYVGLGDGWFYALDRRSGRLRWRVPGVPEGFAERDFVLATPLVFDGLVYLCGPDGVIRAVDAHSGNLIWRVAVEGRFTGSPGISNGIICAGSLSGSVYALESKTGALVWKRQLDGPVAAPVCTGDGRLFVVTEAGRLWALGAETGRVLWQAEVAPGRHPVYGEVVVLVGGKAYDPGDGSLLWEAGALDASPVVWLDQVFYPHGVVDLFSGTPKGPVTGEQAGAEADPADASEGHRAASALDRFIVAGGLLVGVAKDGHLCGREPGSGRLVWRVALGGPSPHPPAAVGQQLFLTLASGTLCTFRVQAQ
ncbi:MAG TPA: PQQ-binding-like beta-propeller repeat protein [Symbiobacteriaceae bacterium]